MARPTARWTEQEDNGHDAFLDIVANLVGILVILVMVVGVRMRHAWEDQTQAATTNLTIQEAPPPADQTARIAERDELIQTVARAEEEAATVENDTKILAYKIDLLATETAQRTAQRNQLQLLVSAIENEIQQHRAQLDGQSQQAFDTAQSLAELQHQLEETQNAVQTVSLDREAPIVIDHYETPVASTVHGHEEHFRIKGGRIARIPLEELVDAMNQDCRKKRWKLKERPQFTATLPVIDGFSIRYVMARTERMFTLHPESELMGQPMQEAMAVGARLRQHIDALSPRETTITVWTYPDSYDEFRQFQEALVQRGFRIAARPLPQDFPIGGSQHGRRSVAQ